MWGLAAWNNSELIFYHSPVSTNISTLYGQIMNKKVAFEIFINFYNFCAIILHNYTIFQGMMITSYKSLYYECIQHNINGPMMNWHEMQKITQTWLWKVSDYDCLNTIILFKFAFVAYSRVCEKILLKCQNDWNFTVKRNLNWSLRMGNTNCHQPKVSRYDFVIISR